MVSRFGCLFVRLMIYSDVISFCSYLYSFSISILKDDGESTPVRYIFLNDVSGEKRKYFSSGKSKIREWESKRGQLVLFDSTPDVQDNIWHGFIPELNEFVECTNTSVAHEDSDEGKAVLIEMTVKESKHLIEFVTEDAMRCNGCSEFSYAINTEFLMGTTMYGCRACNSDLCRSCFAMMKDDGFYSTCSEKTYQLIGIKTMSNTEWQESGLDFQSHEKDPLIINSGHTYLGVKETICNGKDGPVECYQNSKGFFPKDCVAIIGSPEATNAIEELQLAIKDFPIFLKEFVEGWYDSMGPYQLHAAGAWSVSSLISDNTPLVDIPELKLKALPLILQGEWEQRVLEVYSKIEIWSLDEAKDTFIRVLKSISMHRENVSLI